jgi:hypothetical protein
MERSMPVRLRLRLLIVALLGVLLIGVFGAGLALGVAVLHTRVPGDDIVLRSLGWTLTLAGAAGLATSAALTLIALSARAGIRPDGVQASRLRRARRSLSACQAAQWASAVAVVAVGVAFSVQRNAGFTPLVVAANLALPSLLLAVSTGSVRRLLPGG